MKIRNKLILSCAALAAVATTAVSTTFAWYTSNETVQALNASGASADTGSTSIFISGDHENWFNKVDTQSTIDAQKFTVTAQDLLPVSLVDGAWKDEKLEAATPALVQFTLYLKTQDAQAAVPVTISGITIANTSNSVVTRQNYLNGGSYYQDFLDALAFTVESTSFGETEFSTTHGYSLTPGQGVVARLQGNTYSSAANTNHPGNAHTYVNAVAGAGTVTNTSTQTTALAANTKFCTLPTTGYSAFTFKVYLDGADIDCLDACQGQSFNMSISFSVLDES